MNIRTMNKNEMKFAAAALQTQAVAAILCFMIFVKMIAPELCSGSTANAGRGGDIMFYDFCK